MVEQQELDRKVRRLIVSELKRLVTSIETARTHANNGLQNPDVEHWLTEAKANVNAAIDALTE